jgi:hypothetical protein
LHLKPLNLVLNGIQVDDSPLLYDILLKILVK